MNAQQAAVANYHAMYEHFAESAQLYAGTSLQRTIGEVAVMYLLAADTETTDPEPHGTHTTPCCAMCLMYRALPPEAKPASALESESVPDHPHFLPIPGCARCEGVTR